MASRSGYRATISVGTFLNEKGREKSRYSGFDFENMTLRFYTKLSTDSSLLKLHSEVADQADKRRWILWSIAG